MSNANHAASSVLNFGRLRPTAAKAGAVIAAALSQAPEIAAYGLLALAPLGAAFGPQAIALALLGAVAASTVACLAGAGRLVSGPRASLALLTASLVAGLVAYEGPGGRFDATQILVLLALGLLGAGLLQMLFGALRLGTIVKYTPHPVRIGLMSGIGVLLIATALPVMLGRGFGEGLLSLAGGVSWMSALIGTVAAAVMAAAARTRLPVPAVLAGLAAAAALHAALTAAGAPTGLSSLVVVPELPSLWLAQWPTALPSANMLLSPKLLGMLGAFALTVATLATLDSLLAASVLDGRLRRTRDANAELRAQGLANVATALVGGQAASPSVPRSLALVVPMPAARFSVLWYALALLACLLLAPGLIGLLPGAAIGGVLVLQGMQMIAPSLWRTPLSLWDRRRRVVRPAFDSAQRRLLLENWVVAIAVALNTALLGLGPAVLIGATFAVLLFVRANMRDVVRRVRSGDIHHSLKMRLPEEARVLQEDGHRIAVLELEGALFFGTADALRARLEAISKTADTAILDLHQVGEIDATAARILLETGEDWASHDKELVAAEWSPGDPRRRIIEAMATPAGAPGLRFAPDTDEALEQAEQHLLERRGLQAEDTRTLAFGATQLGRGLGADDLALLAAQMTTLQVARGEVLFRAGDPGDALYISLRGHIGLRLPGGTRRLASFAPGVTMGEMALLDQRPRSAEAVAETDLDLLRLSAQAFEKIRSDHPALAAKILNNISLHLADRVRALTTELAGWVSRAASGRMAPVEFDPVLDADRDSSD